MPVTFRCPICGKAVDSSDPNMPFCSDRCRVVDLGNWASEKYSIPGNRPTELEESEETRNPEGSTQ
ncbi:MAG: DNA gyrase inhibitor YacG [Bryobacteraceae bacterium]